MMYRIRQVSRRSFTVRRTQHHTSKDVRHKSSCIFIHLHLTVLVEGTFSIRLAWVTLEELTTVLSLVMATSLSFHHGLSCKCRNDCRSAQRLEDSNRRGRSLQTLYWARNLFEVLHWLVRFVWFNLWTIRQFNLLNPSMQLNAEVPWKFEWANFDSVVVCVFSFH